MDHGSLVEHGEQPCLPTFSSTYRRPRPGCRRISEIDLFFFLTRMARSFFFLDLSFSQCVSPFTGFSTPQGLFPFSLLFFSYTLT